VSSQQFDELVKSEEGKLIKIGRALNIKLE
jgi:hypothetical protein